MSGKSKYQQREDLRVILEAARTLLGTTQKQVINRIVNDLGLDGCKRESVQVAMSNWQRGERPLPEVYVPPVRALCSELREKFLLLDLNGKIVGDTYVEPTPDGPVYHSLSIEEADTWEMKIMVDLCRECRHLTPRDGNYCMHCGEPHRQRRILDDKDYASSSRLRIEPLDPLEDTEPTEQGADTEQTPDPTNGTTPPRKEKHET